MQGGGHRCWAAVDPGRRERQGNKGTGVSNLSIGVGGWRGEKANLMSKGNIRGKIRVGRHFDAGVTLIPTGLGDQRAGERESGTRSLSL